MIDLQPYLALPSAIQFDAVSIGNALVASTITVSSAITASLLVVQNLASINSLVVSSNASVNRLVASSNIQGVIGSFNRLEVVSNIQAVVGSFNGLILASDITAVIASVNRVVVASNIQAVIGSFDSLVITSTVTASLLVVQNIASINHLHVTSTADFSAASFVGAVAMTGSLNVTGGVQASNASVAVLVVTGSHSVAGVSQFSAASFSGAIQACDVSASRLVLASNLQAVNGSFSNEIAVGLPSLVATGGALRVAYAAGYSSRNKLGTNNITLLFLTDDGVTTNVINIGDTAQNRIKMSGPIQVDGGASFTGAITLSAIAAGGANLVINATTDTPSTVFSTLTGFNQLPDGYMEITKGGSAVYIPFFR